VAKQAVNCAPSEFSTWAKLTEIYIELGMFENALLTLNSCPMFTVNERDLHRMPTPWKTFLPVKAYIEESGILEDTLKDEEVSD
jgi:Chs5-Arf1p-binding protein BUD7/BCH1